VYLFDLLLCVVFPRSPLYYTYLFPLRLYSKLKEETNSNKYLYPNLILNIISLLIIRINKVKLRALYNSPIIKDLLLGYFTPLDLYKILVTPSLIYKINYLYIINIINNININNILEKREEEDKETSSNKRPRTPPTIISNLVLSLNP